MAKKKRWQVSTYISTDEKRQFRDYARSMGIDGSSLLVLLMLRAGRVGPSQQQVEEAARRATTGADKITAHFADEDVYAKVVSVLENVPGGLNPSRLCGVLIRLELEERWLAREVGIDSR